MQIRARLTLQFLLSGGIIMMVASAAIYFSTASFRKVDFNSRLKNNALNTANLLFKEYEVDVARVLRIEKENPVSLQNEKIIIINLKNNVIFSSDQHSEIKIGKSEIERVRSGNPLSYKQGLYDVVGSLYFTNYDQFVILAAATDLDGSLQLRKLMNVLIIVCLISLLLFFIIGWYSSGRAIKPISDLVKKVEEISITSLNLRVYEGIGNDEIGRLAKTFNKMLERLEISFGIQKNFIASASHELRTPLTSINGQLEVLMMKDRSTVEYRSALGSVLEDIKSLIGLSNRLLLIASTSAEGSKSFSKKIRIDETIWQVQEEMKKFNDDYHIGIIIDDSLTDSSQMTVLGDEYLLKIAVSNIIDNACKYSNDHSVVIMFHHVSKCIEILFEDNGFGISGEDLNRVFEPFYRGTNTFSISGYGIGLALTDQIIKNHNGEIKISSQIGIGTKIVISLPAIS